MEMVYPTTTGMPSKAMASMMVSVFCDADALKMVRLKLAPLLARTRLGKIVEPTAPKRAAIDTAEARKALPPAPALLKTSMPTIASSAIRLAARGSRMLPS